MAEARCVIIGNGPAANEAATVLRSQAPDLRITMVSQEHVPAYRPHLLPSYIAGEISERGLYVGPLEFYREQGVELRLGQRVVNVDFRNREIMLDHKEVVPFGGLIIAVGGTPRIPEPLQLFEELMLTLKTLADANAWRERLAKTDRVLIVGGDLTSLSLTRALLALGKHVSFMLDEESFRSVPFTAEVKRQVESKLTDKGVDVIEGGRITRLARISDDELEVEIGGLTLKVGVMGAFFGLAPNVKFLARSGLDIDRGILVDETLKTRFDHVYAAGDCAQVYHPALRNYWVSIGYENARNLGKIAALNLLGGMFKAEVSEESIFNVDGIAVNNSWWTEF